MPDYAARKEKIGELAERVEMCRPLKRALNNCLQRDMEQGVVIKRCCSFSTGYISYVIGIVMVR